MPEETPVVNTPPEGGTNAAQAPAGNVSDPVGGTGTTGEVNWRDGIAEDLRGDPALKDFKDVGGLAKSYVETKKMVGDGIRLPDEKDPDAQAKTDEIYTKLGRPDKPDGYTAQMPNDGDISWDEDSVGQFKDVAHAAGLNNKQAQDVMNWYGGLVQAGMKEQNEALQSAVEELKSDWGSSYDRNMAITLQAINKIGGPELEAELGANGLGNSPHLTKLIYSFAKNLAEDGIIPGEVAGVTGVEEAKAKIEAIKANPDHPYFHADAPGYKEATDEMYRLMQIVTGGKKEEEPISVGA